MKFLMALMLGIGLIAAPAMAQEVTPSAGSAAGGGADTNMEIFIQKINADKKLLERWPQLFGQNVPFLKWSLAVF